MACCASYFGGVSSEHECRYWIVAIFILQFSLHPAWKFMDSKQAVIALFPNLNSYEPAIWCCLTCVIYKASLTFTKRKSMYYCTLLPLKGRGRHRIYVSSRRKCRQVILEQSQFKKFRWSKNLRLLT